LPDGTEQLLLSGSLSGHGLTHTPPSPMGQFLGTAPRELSSQRDSQVTPPMGGKWMRISEVEV